MEDGEYTAVTDDAWCLFGEEHAENYTLSADVKFTGGDIKGCVE